MAIHRMFVEVAFLRHDDQDAGPVELPKLEIIHADQMRGELEMSKNGMPDLSKAPLSATTAWVYHALVRQKLYGGPFAQFWTHDLIGFEKLDDEPVVKVDPTEEPSGSASPSPSPTATPGSG